MSLSSEVKNYDEDNDDSTSNNFLLEVLSFDNFVFGPGM